MTPAAVAQLRKNAVAAGNARAVAALSAADPRQTIAGDAPLSVEIDGLRIESTLNERGHWAKRKLLRQHQRSMVKTFLGRKVLPALPVVVELVRVFNADPAGDKRRREKPFDDDGAVAGFKSVRDAVAALYGVTDADPAVIEFRVSQLAAAHTGVIVRVLPRREGTVPR